MEDITEAAFVEISPGGQWQIGLQLVAWHGEDFSCLLASYIVL